MPRAHLRYIVQDSSGNVQTSTTVNVYKVGTTTNITDTMYDARSGGSTLSNPLTSNSQGEIEAWFEVPGTDVPGYADLKINTTTPFTETIEIIDSPLSSPRWANVRAYGATGDGVTDDSAAVIDATTAAGTGGCVYFPVGTYILNNWTPSKSNLTIQGAGWGAVLKAKASAAAALTISQLAGVTVKDLTLDGNSNASDCVRVTGATFASSLQLFDHIKFLNGLVGINILAGSPTDEADQCTYLNCFITGCTTGFKDVSPNGQSHVFINPRFGTTTTCLSVAGACTLTMLTGEGSGYTTFLTFPTAGAVSGSYVYLQDVLLEGGVGCTDIDGSVGWPSQGVEIKGCGLRGAVATVVMGVNSTSLIAAQTAFVTGNVNITANTTNFFDTLCSFSSGAAYNPTGTTNKRIRTDGSGITTYIGTTQMYQLDTATGFIDGAEITDPSAPAANHYKLYAKDNGSGKTLLVVRFSSGAVQTIATQP